ncbi:uncharacterized protein PV09_06359 [Verruconis gallopava]|uniref:FAD/NAD(P)-binding domain-containing protein n=1 Tax=Verruconis gallopava TaxID=253628 RepID=A0A0D2A634_9PEZI|nr:uncharacterized protein PV09_06359 [Verruconis gallopava]KIW02203.1 hypothetical protein PV09_06359 [Verruconis gallopava]
MDVPPENVFDVIIIGAGITGINFAYRLQERLPHLTYVVLEGRHEIGGTWSYFKYPGIRSDSDLYTFGFPWRPWMQPKAIAEAELILPYMRESAAMYGIDKKIRFHHMVETAKWSSPDQNWKLGVRINGEKETAFKSRFLLFGAGYYDYKEPLKTYIPGIENFKGPLVQAQFYDPTLDYTDKNVVVIGSGATAVTVVPAMAEKAKHVIMLQRSPNYLLSAASEDSVEVFIRRWLPKTWAHTVIRWKWLWFGFFMVKMCKFFPNYMTKLLRTLTVAELPPEVSHDPHFKPRYAPWEQRMCFCPNSDFFEAVRQKKASVVTGVIEQVTEDSIRLTDGQVLKPDIIVQATGLKIQFGGNIDITVDGNPYKINNDKFIWKNMMFQDLPNAAYGIGYVDAAWTLGADTAAQMFVRIVKRMERQGVSSVVPTIEKGKEPAEGPSFFKLTSTYVTLGKKAFPKTGKHPQWAGRSTYMYDLYQAKFGDIVTGMKYVRPPMIKAA